MSEHRLTEIHREDGQTETRLHAVCVCGWIGPDHGAKDDMFSRAEAVRKARADHKLHAEDRSPSRAPDDAPNPGVRAWSEQIEREGL